MEGDLLLAGVASALMKSAKPAGGSPTSSGPVTAQFSSEQIDQLAGALMQGIRNIELPTPQVQVPPAQVQFPDNLKLSFTDAELERISTSIAGKSRIPKLIETRVLTLDVDGNTCFADFPTIKRLLSYQFTQSYYLVAVTISCSIVNTDTAVAGLFFGRDLGPIVNIEQQSDTQTASDIYISQLTHQNSTVATIAPLSRTNTIAFSGDQQFIQIQAGSRLALYGCGTNNSNNLYSAVINLHVLAESNA